LKGCSKRTAFFVLDADAGADADCQCEAGSGLFGFVMETNKVIR
jgi:hypothetical protein